MSNNDKESLRSIIDKDLVDELGADPYVRYTPMGDRKPADSILSKYTKRKEKYSHKVPDENPYFTETKDLPLGNKSQFQYIPYDDYTMSAKVARNIEDDSGDIPYLPRDYYSNSSDIENFNADKMINRKKEEISKQISKIKMVTAPGYRSNEDTTSSDSEIPKGILPENEEYHKNQIKLNLIKDLEQETEVTDSDIELHGDNQLIFKKENAILDNKYNSKVNEPFIDKIKPNLSIRTKKSLNEKEKIIHIDNNPNDYNNIKEEPNPDFLKQFHSDLSSNMNNKHKQQIFNNKPEDDISNESANTNNESGDLSDDSWINLSTIKLPKDKRAKESAFWIEIIQRGRVIAKDFDINIDLCSNNRVGGLNVLEWFGFLDKYYSESPNFNTKDMGLEVLMPYSNMGPEYYHSDKRFVEPTGRNLSSLYPEFKEALEHSNLSEVVELKRDPRTVALSLKKFLDNFKLSNTSSINYANRMRMKPTGLQEDYLAKLLARVSSKEMKQVITKKLYQEKQSKMTDIDYQGDILGTVLTDIVKTQDFTSHPLTFDLPDEYQMPNYNDEIEQALETEEINTGSESASSDDEVVEKTKHWVNENRERKNTPKGCRICSGMQLEPMNGPLLMQLIDDCGLVLPRRQTNLCVVHQRKIKRVLSRSVAMGVIDLKGGIIKYLNPFEPELFPGEVHTPKNASRSANNAYNK